MNIVLIGKSDEIDEHSDFLHNIYGLVKINGDIVLRENNITVSKGKKNYGLFESVFNKIMSEHIDKMAMEHLKTGFVFINYPVNESQIHNLDCKLDGMDTSIDIIIELFDKDDNNNDNDILWDRNKQNLHRWVTIETNNKDNSQVGEEIIKSITRMAMKKIIHSRGFIGSKYEFSK